MADEFDDDIDVEELDSDENPLLKTITTEEEEEEGSPSGRRDKRKTNGNGSDRLTRNARKRRRKKEKEEKKKKVKDDNVYPLVKGLPLDESNDPGEDDDFSYNDEVGFCTKFIFVFVMISVGVGVAMLFAHWPPKVKFETQVSTDSVDDSIESATYSTDDGDFGHDDDDGVRDPDAFEWTQHNPWMEEPTDNVRDTPPTDDYYSTVAASEEDRSRHVEDEVEAIEESRGDQPAEDQIESPETTTWFAIPDMFESETNSKEDETVPQPTSTETVGIEDVPEATVELPTEAVTAAQELQGQHYEDTTESPQAQYYDYNAVYWDDQLKVYQQDPATTGDRNEESNNNDNDKSDANNYDNNNDNSYTGTWNWDDFEDEQLVNNERPAIHYSEAEDLRLEAARKLVDELTEAEDIGHVVDPLVIDAPADEEAIPVQSQEDQELEQATHEFFECMANNGVPSADCHKRSEPTSEQEVPVQPPAAQEDQVVDDNILTEDDEIYFW